MLEMRLERTCAGLSTGQQATANKVRLPALQEFHVVLSAVFDSTNRRPRPSAEPLHRAVDWAQVRIAILPSTV